MLLLDLTVKFTNGTEQNRSANETSQWRCHLVSEHRFDCQNLFNFYFSSHSLCADDDSLFGRQNIDELHIYNDYNCFDHTYQCYLEFDSTWTKCFKSLKKLVIENLSFIVRYSDTKKLLPVDYLKIVNTHGSITELLGLLEFSNTSSIYIQSPHPRWSGMDLYTMYLKSATVKLKQLWINVADWYPIAYLRYDQMAYLRVWLLKIRCLHIELGDCRSYYHDMIALRDLFGSRQEIASELYCHLHEGGKRSHWSQVPELCYNYIMPKQPSPNSLATTELQEKCFAQFTKEYYTVNANTDLLELYSNFRKYESQSIPLWTVYSYATLPNLPFTSTMATITTAFVNRRPVYPSTIDFLNIYSYALASNETRWLSYVEAYPDGRFVIIDNKNQQILLLNRNGTFRIDLTPIYFRQIQSKIDELSPQPNVHSSYSFSKLHIDQDGYTYLIPTVAYYIYVFSPHNRLIRCLTPQLLGISSMRSDCFTITYTGLIYVCDDAYRVIRIYSRMGIPHRTMRLDYLPLKLFISNNRIFTYSLENLATIQMYTLTGVRIKKLSMCSYNVPSEVNWFRGRYFLTCGSFLYVINEQGEQLAEHNLQKLVDCPGALVTIHDFALNKNGIILATFRRNGTLFNRYWIIKPATF
ncbi:unnamed protein product [Rotaria magnacalcarata]|uniref:Uncharacterized protein n=1 Tax=Rotaria magnacalcarata TaxID=392030 RepID=A0A816RS07_9BILA|nr:unnamed protein product [Rotaria magnacalcarata]CAF3736573.1 unnamed protein product [Rotaria magnacalcarata]